MIEEVASYRLRVAGRISHPKNPQLVTRNLSSHLQLVIRLSVENEKFFVVVSWIGPEG